MTDLQVLLLGQFQVSVNGRPVTNFASDKVRALLSYLIAESQCPIRREILADLFWPEKPEPNSRANLRRALANLRMVIGDHQSETPSLLVSRQDIQFRSSCHAWADVDQLNEIYELEKYTPEDPDPFGAILDLYQGEFLSGLQLRECLNFDEWLLMTREQYARKAAAILTRAGNCFETAREYEKALPFVWRLVELEPWQEGARRQLMRLLAAAGQRDEALLQYQSLQETLMKELGISPEPQTTELYDQIIAGIFQISAAESPSLISVRDEIPDFLRPDYPNSVKSQEKFIGRQTEIGQMHQLLMGVLAGQGKATFVAGEAGAGKTLLMREFILQAQRQHPSLVAVIGSCNALTGMGDPYLPFREIFYQLSGDVKMHWKLGAYSRDYALRLWKTIPVFTSALLTFGQDLIGTIIPEQALLEFAAALASDHPNLYQELESLVQYQIDHPASSPDQTNMFSQFGQILQAIAEDQPVLLVLDDLQWADSGTLGLLFHLGKQLAGSQVMLLGAFRSEEVSIQDHDLQHPLVPILSEFKRDFGNIVINLDQTSKKDFVIELLASEPNILDESFLNALYSYTGGHALFTVETLRTMQFSGVLAKNKHGLWVQKSDACLETLPPRIEGIIAQRFNRLPIFLQQILTLASIQGEEFIAEIIANIEGVSDAEIMTILSDQLDKQHRLVQALKVERQGERLISSYRFRHFLFQKYIYNRLDDVEMVRLQNQIGLTIEALVGENHAEYSISLAHHFEKAIQMQKASGYYYLAGKRALRMAAIPEAISHFENALRLLLSLPETPERNAQELGIQLQLGLAYQATMGFASEIVGAAFQRAWELCQTVEDDIKKITTSQLLFSYYSNIADFKTAVKNLDYIEKTFSAMEEVLPEFILQLEWGRGYLHSIFGEHQACLEKFEKAIKSYEQIKDQTISERVGMEPGIYCYSWAGLHANWLGYPDKAKSYIDAAFRIADRYDSNLFTNDAFWFSTWTSLELQDLEAARRYNQASIEISTKENYLLFLAMGFAFRGRILTREGKYQEAIESIQQGLAMFKMMGAVVCETLWLQALAEAYLGAGMLEDGLDAIRRIEDIEQKIGEFRMKAGILKTQGDLHAASGDDPAAERAYLEAINVAQQQSAKLLELEAAKSLAKLWHLQGKTKLAAELLSEIYAWFTEGFDTPMLVEARELLDEFSAAH